MRFFIGIRKHCCIITPRLIITSQYHEGYKLLQFLWYAVDPSQQNLMKKIQLNATNQTRNYVLSRRKCISISYRLNVSGTKYGIITTAKQIEFTLVSWWIFRRKRRVLIITVRVWIIYRRINSDDMEYNVFVPKMHYAYIFLLITIFALLLTKLDRDYVGRSLDNSSLFFSDG